jgi:hypothetical protein
VEIDDAAEFSTGGWRMGQALFSGENQKKSGEIRNIFI